MQRLLSTNVGLLDDEIGRVTRGFALAVKAKALLYAASPLHNPSNDRSKWQKAAAAAKELMDLGIYRLDPAEKANNYLSQEVIFAIMRSESQSFERYNFPVRFTEGQRTSIAGNYPTQNLVDAFQTAGGYDITLEANGWRTADPAFDITKPYEGRDPRFARTILANGMSFKGTTIETFVGGRDYSATRSDLGSPTGYYLRRYIQESTSFTPENTVTNKPPHLRRGPERVSGQPDGDGREPQRQRARRPEPGARERRHAGGERHLRGRLPRGRAPRVARGVRL